MGTKANPGSYDCYGAADDDEPLFTLRARDPLAPVLVKLWVELGVGLSPPHVTASFVNRYLPLLRANYTPRKRRKSMFVGPVLSSPGFSYVTGFYSRPYLPASK